VRSLEKFINRISEKIAFKIVSQGGTSDNGQADTPVQGFDDKGTCPIQ